MAAPGPRRWALVLVAAAGLLAGCGGDGDRGDLAPDTARFTYGERAVTVPLDECGRDGDVLTVEGRWARLDGDLRPDPAQPPMAGRLQARCPEVATDDAA